jgi:hypothetical protein
MFNLSQAPNPCTSHRRQLRRLNNRFMHARRQHDAAHARMIALLTEAGRLGAEQRLRDQLALDGGCTCASCRSERCPTCDMPPPIVDLRAVPANGCRTCGAAEVAS